MSKSLLPQSLVFVYILDPNIMDSCSTSTMPMHIHATKWSLCLQNLLTLTHGLTGQHTNKHSYQYTLLLNEQ